MPLTWKNPDAVFTYTLDFTPDLGQGETLTSIVFIRSTLMGFVTSDSTSEIIAALPAPVISGNTVIFWLQNGKVGEHHLIEVAVLTNQSRIWTGDIDLNVVDK